MQAVLQIMTLEKTTLTQDQDDVDALHKMKHELTKMPHYEQSAFVHAQRISPNLVDDQSLLMFLQTESFDASVSALNVRCFITAIDALTPCLCVA